MSTKLFVGNLSYSTTELSLRDLFAAHGAVLSSNIVLDRVSGQSRGFAFVEFESRDAAESAIRALDGSDLDGRPLSVSVARPRGEGGGGRGGGYGNRG